MIDRDELVRFLEMLTPEVATDAGALHDAAIVGAAAVIAAMPRIKADTYAPNAAVRAEQRAHMAMRIGHSARNEHLQKSGSWTVIY